MQNSLNAETLIAIENAAADYMLSRWESRHRLEVRSLSEMIVCSSHGSWGRDFDKFNPIAPQMCTEGSAAFAECVDLYKAAHSIADDELAAATVEFRLMNDLPVDEVPA